MSPKRFREAILIVLARRGGQASRDELIDDLLNEGVDEMTDEQFESWKKAQGLAVDAGYRFARAAGDV